MRKWGGGERGCVVRVSEKGTSRCALAAVHTWATGDAFMDAVVVWEQGPCTVYIPCTAVYSRLSNSANFEAVAISPRDVILLSSDTL